MAFGPVRPLQSHGMKEIGKSGPTVAVDRVTWQSVWVSNPGAMPRRYAEVLYLLFMFFFSIITRSLSRYPFLRKRVHNTSLVSFSPDSIQFILNYFIGLLRRPNYSPPPHLSYPGVLPGAAHLHERARQRHVPHGRLLLGEDNGRVSALHSLPHRLRQHLLFHDWPQRQRQQLLHLRRNRHPRRQLRCVIRWVPVHIIIICYYYC